MMVSNGLSARRGPLRRPKVCLTHPNPGRCEPPPPPPPPASCSIVPSSITVEISDIPGFVLTHCNPSLPVHEEIDIQGDVDEGEFIINDGSMNCDEGSAEYQPSIEGIFLCTMTVTFSDSSTCVATTTVTVIDPEL